MAAKSVIVAVGGGRHDLKQAQNLLANILKEAGCQGCLSGYDIHFVNEGELFAHGAQVNVKQVQAGP